MTLNVLQVIASDAFLADNVIKTYGAFVAVKVRTIMTFVFTHFVIVAQALLLLKQIDARQNE